MLHFYRLIAAVCLIVSGTMFAATPSKPSQGVVIKNKRIWTPEMLVPNFVWPPAPTAALQSEDDDREESNGELAQQGEDYDDEENDESTDDSIGEEPSEDDDDEEDGETDLVYMGMKQSEEDDDERAPYVTDSRDGSDVDSEIDDSDNEVTEDEGEYAPLQIVIRLAERVAEECSENALLSPRLLAPSVPFVPDLHRSYRSQTVSLSPLERPSARNVMIFVRPHMGEPAPARGANVVQDLETQVRDQT